MWGAQNKNFYEESLSHLGFSSHSLGRESAGFSIKGQQGNILGLVGHMVSAPLLHSACTARATKDNGIEDERNVAVPIKLYLQNKQGAGCGPGAPGSTRGSHQVTLQLVTSAASPSTKRLAGDDDPTSLPSGPIQRIPDTYTPVVLNSHHSFFPFLLRLCMFETFYNKN